jgi:hypothetical protein
MMITRVIRIAPDNIIFVYQDGSADGRRAQLRLRDQYSLSIRRAGFSIRRTLPIPIQEY